MPRMLEDINCSHNRLTELPSMPYAVDKINCAHNSIRRLRYVLPSVTELDCSGNQLTFLPRLPKTITKLECDDNPWNSEFDDFLWIARPWRLRNLGILRILNGGPREMVVDQPKQENEYVTASHKYDHAMTKIKKQARKLIVVNRILYNSPLNSDVGSLICSFLSGEEGSLRGQVAALGRTYKAGVGLI